MITDVVCEKLVKRKFEGRAVAAFGAKLLAIVLMMALSVLVMLRFAAALIILPLVLIPVGIWLIIKVIKNRNVEYEYDFVNGMLTVDKIINMADRKHLFDLDVKKVEKIGEFDPDEFNMHGVDFLGNYTATDAMDNAYFLLYKGDSGKTNVVVLEKDDPEAEEKILEAMRRYINPLVFREGFKHYGN